MVDQVSNYMLMRLLAALVECEPATFEVIHQDSGIGGHTVRRGLNVLEVRGLVESRTDLRTHRFGRTPIIYSLTCKGRQLAPYMLTALRRLETACA